MTDDAAMLAKFRELRRTDDRRLRDELVTAYRSIAEACARRFADRGEPLDDLVQVGLLGLVKAVDRFDPEQGVPFAGFAVPTVTGEIRRHFRDTTWAVHVPRRAKDLHVRMPKAVERLHSTLGRSPTTTELADELDATVDDVLDALDAGAAYRSTTTDTPQGGAVADATASRVGSDSLPIDDRLLLEQLVQSLPERERAIVWLRFFEDLSQEQIAARMDMSQVHVSRLLRKSLRLMRDTAGGA